jgi:Ran GTPase-activating protein (RanGAP) involved in mRNA processing and transport
VDLSRQELTDEDMHIIVKEVIIKKQCKQLVLTSNKITSVGVSIVAQALNTNNTLEILELDDNQACDRGVESLVKALLMNNNILKKLGLAKNGITDEGVRHLAQMSTTNQILTQLDLCSNEISDEGVQILANAIRDHNSTIEMLWLTSNKMLTDESVDSLIHMIQYKRSLKRLWIFKCNLSEIGKERLKKVEYSKMNLKVYVNSWKD